MLAKLAVRPLRGPRLGRSIGGIAYPRRIEPDVQMLDVVLAARHGFGGGLLDQIHPIGETITRHVGILLVAIQPPQYALTLPGKAVSLRSYGSSRPGSVSQQVNQTARRPLPAAQEAA